MNLSVEEFWKLVYIYRSTKKSNTRYTTFSWTWYM